MTIMLMTLLFLIIPGSGYAQCSSTNTTFRKNKKILLDLLAKNAPLHDGFYFSSVGNNSDQVYGVSQCKANISSNLCAKCLNSSMGSFDECPDSLETTTMSIFCTTMISNQNIIGVWTNSSLATHLNEGLDDPLVFSKGFSMMQDLARTVPYQPLMYRAAVIDVGVDGKRYGFAQCGRYLSKLNCQNCLENSLEGYRSSVNNRTDWEILGSSCSMWYSNVSDAYKDQDVGVIGFITWGLPPSPSPDSEFPPGTATVTSGTQRCHEEIVIEASIWISTFTILLLSTQVFHFS